MKIIFAIIEGTFREALARKTLVGFFILSSVMILIAFLVFQNPTVSSAMHESKQVRDADVAAGILNTTVLDVAWSVISVIFFIFTMCMGVFSTASFISSMMEKGTIDLLLSKSVARWQYIIGRYIGAMLIIFLEVAWFILGVWVVISLSVGAWNWGFPVSIVHILLGYAGLYSVVVLVSVLSKSSLLAIIASIGLAFVSMLVSFGKWAATLVDTGPRTVWGYIGDGFYYIFPQVTEMAKNMAWTIIGKPITWGPIGLISLLTVVYLGLSIYAFNKKEF
jgi:ABC-type transport system involved in multi-copper enzyme maturation permease subunit